MKVVITGGPHYVYLLDLLWREFRVVDQIIFPLRIVKDPHQTDSTLHTRILFGHSEFAVIFKVIGLKTFRDKESWPEQMLEVQEGDLQLVNKLPLRCRGLQSPK